MVVEGQSCCTRFCGKILDPTHLLVGVAPWRYLRTIKAPGEVGFGLRRLRAVPRKESIPRFPRRGTPVQDTVATLALGSRRQDSPRQCMHVHTFAAVPPVEKYRVLGIQLLYGNMFRWIRRKGR